VRSLVFITAFPFLLALTTGCSRKDVLPEPCSTDSLGCINRWTLQPSINRVFALTSHATASVAELVLNNLKPFVNLVQIGTTAGKDEASFTIMDQRSPREME